jgi:hypothetical protein
MDGLTPEHALTLFRWLKEGPPGSIPIVVRDAPCGSLQAITWEDAGDLDALDRICAWHGLAFAWLPDPVPVTHTSIRRWLVEQVLEVPTRVLFWIKTHQDICVGHVGLSSLDQAGNARLCDLLVGHPRYRNLLDAGIRTLTDWSRESLHLNLTGPAAAAA